MSESTSQWSNPKVAPNIVSACVKYRALAKSCLSQHSLAGAIFYADKVVTMSSGEPSDVFLLADAYFRSNKYEQALYLLGKYEYLLQPGYPHFCRLATQCMLAQGMNEEALSLLDRIIPDTPEGSGPGSALQSLVRTHPAVVGEEINVIAQLCTLKAKALEAAENRSRAAAWFVHAMRCDAHCYDAFEQLVDKQMLKESKEHELLTSLPFGTETNSEELAPVAKLTKLIYRSRILKYNPTDDVEVHFQKLRSEWGLADNADILSAEAEQLYYRHDTTKAHALTIEVRKRDPFLYRNLPVTISTMVDLGLKSELFYCAHQLVRAHVRFHFKI